MKNEQVRLAAKRLLSECLSLRKSDQILILASAGSRDLAAIMHQSAAAACRNAFLVYSEFGRLYQGKIAPALNAMLAEADKVIFIDAAATPRRLMPHFAHLDNAMILCIDACMPRTFARWMNGNQRKISSRTHKIADLLTIGRTLELETPDGTHVNMNIRSTSAHADAAYLNGQGKFGCLPAGEVRFYPEIKSIEGRIAVNFVAGEVSEAHPTLLIVQQGEIQQIRGKTQTAEILRKEIKKQAALSRSVIGFGLGTNDKAEYGKTLIEDRKVLGGASVAIGQRRRRTRKPVACGIMLAPSLSIDGRKIVESGKLIINT